jgi:hypothetical protein
MRHRLGCLLAALALAACAPPPLSGPSGLSTVGASPRPEPAATNPPAVGPLPVPVVGPLGPIFPHDRPPVPVGSAGPFAPVGLGGTVILVVPAAPSPSPSPP